MTNSVSLEAVLGHDVWRFHKTLSKEERPAFASALKQCQAGDFWKELPFPFRRGCFGARIGGYYFIATKEPSGAMFVIQVGRPMDGVSL
jgi:hypothetical protein